MATKMDLTVCRDHFAAAKTNTNDVDIESLIQGYEEIARLYDSMGQVFHFASKEMRSRTKSLQVLIKENPAVYSDVVTAVNHEKAQGIKKKTKSGAKAASKILMDIHWDIVYFIHILQKLAEAQDDSKMSQLCRTAYDETLALHQPLPLRTAARLACKTLPVRKEFVDKYMKQDTAECISLISSVIAAMTGVNTIMEAAFVRNELMKEAHVEAEQNKMEDQDQADGE